MQNTIDTIELRTWITECGDLARRQFNYAVGRRKADLSFVTETDLAIEKLLVTRLLYRYPDYGILAEEGTSHAIDREFVWALDPLDGTASFIAGLPLWGISLGLLRHGQPYFGMIYLPLLDACYWAGPDGPAYYNGISTTVLAPSHWHSDDWICVPSNAHRRFTIDFRGKTRCLSGTAASFCYVARGSAIAALIDHVSLWDLVGGLAILRAAGGNAINLDGTPFDITTLLDRTNHSNALLVGAADQLERLRPAIKKLAS
ncbi:MAG TPA: inositol monophosphatase family protein [Roseiflexaceae bacterium]|nr:inositol monophosphatase family protein [Roseiflexaceae bacterium]HMP39861.1 inositol monophosphatase family protein [Roseiflexaceae bacterium]